MALDVRPSLLILDAGNNVLTNAVIFRYQVLTPVVLANCLYLFFGKLCQWAALALVAPAYFYRVLHIFRARTPSQILNAVIESVGVVVASIKRPISWAFKSSKNHPVNWVLFMAGGCVAKTNIQIPMASDKRLHWLAFKPLRTARVVSNYSVIAAYIAKARGRIKPLVSWYLFPYFHIKTHSKYGFNYNRKGTYSGT